MVLITPHSGTPTEHARLLLALAEDVNHVQTTADGPIGTSFYVPEYLAELYAQALVHMEDEQAHDPEAGEEEEPVEPEAEESEPVKRKPGRPRNTDKV